MKPRSRAFGLCSSACVVLTGFLSPATAQTTIPPPGSSIDVVRTAWLRHEFTALVSTSDTVRLQLPGVGRAAAIRPAHAARFLKEYMEAAREVAFELAYIREVSEDHVYAQIVRTYVVQGTSDERIETVFLGFRWRDGVWRLREVRVTP